MTERDSLLGFFKTGFGKTATRTQLQSFDRELGRLNLSVMSKALGQAAEIAKKRNVIYPDVQAQVMTHYAIIVAKLAQMFPALFVFETAWRGFVTSALVDHYGEEGWWHEVRDLVACERDVAKIAFRASLISELAGREVSSSLIKTLVHILGQTSVECSGLETTYQLVEEASLYDLQGLLEAHWSVVSKRFTAPSGDHDTIKREFLDRFTRVRLARNALYHHRVVVDRHKAVAAAEALLDLLDIHLIGMIDEITKCSLQPLVAGVGKTVRHG